MTEKYCSQCGEILVPGAKFCPGCGRTVGQNTANRPAASQNTNTWNGTPMTNNPSSVNSFYQPPVEKQPPFQAPVLKSMSKKEYRKVCTNEKYRKELKTSAISLYVLIVLNAVIAIAANPAGLIDAAIYLALTLGMHLGKSKACAIGVLCYAIFCVIVTLASTGNFGGWLWIIAAIGAIKAFSVADKEYEATYGG